MIMEPLIYPHQKRKNLLYRHSCRPCRVSDALEQESAVPLNVNLFLSVLGFRFTTSQILPKESQWDLSRLAQRTGLKCVAPFLEVSPPYAT